MRVAFVNDTFLLGRGSDTVVYELAKCLGERHEVFVIASEVGGFEEENFKVLKINSKKLLSGNVLEDSLSYFSKLLRFRREVLRLHRRYSFDVFNVHHSSLNPAFKGLPTVVTWHGSPPSSNVLRVFLNNLVLRSLKWNKLSVVVSDYLRQELSRFVSLDKVVRVYNGVSEEFNSRGVRDEGFMLFVGRLEKYKRVSDLIKLSADLGFPLRIVGSGPEESWLKGFAKSVGADSVEFLGRVPREELVEHYKRCSFFVSASQWEGFGLIFVEAAACGKPSIGYGVGSVSEVVRSGVTGFVVSSYSEFLEKAELLVSDVGLRKKLGEEALRFSKRFSWSESARGYENVFNSFKDD